MIEEPLEVVDGRAMAKTTSGTPLPPKSSATRDPKIHAAPTSLLSARRIAAVNVR
jgi:hypothetical protein